MRTSKESRTDYPQTDRDSTADIPEDWDFSLKHYEVAEGWQCPICGSLILRDDYLTYDYIERVATHIANHLNQVISHGR